MQFFDKKYAGALFLSMGIPLLIVGINYFLLGIYPGGKATVLASDGFTQFANFYAGFNNALHGEGSLFYSWSGSMGLNFWALMGYYVNGIFTFVVYFFDNLHIPDAMYVMTLLKFGAMGGAFFIYAKRTYRLQDWQMIGLSISYALMGYSIAYSPIIMWLDTMVYLPLIFLGIHLLMDERRPSLLFISYLLMFLTNYYMAFMVGVFTFLYFCGRSWTDPKKYRATIPMYLITSFLAGGAAMITILPSVLDLKNNGEGLSPVKNILTKDVGIWDFIVKSMPSVYDTSKYKSAPFVYMGLIVLVFLIFYFVSKKVPLRNKLIYGSLFILLIVSVYLDPLNLFWQGFHAPNMFLYRFTFLFSAFGVMIAGFGLEQFERRDVPILINIILGIGSIFLLALLLMNKKRYDYVSQETILLTFAILSIYLVLFLCYEKQIRFQRVLPVLFLVCLSSEAFFNTKALIEGIGKEWGYPEYGLYTGSYNEIKSLVDQTKEENADFYRLENLDGVSRDDSFNYGYHGLTMFSSVRNRKSSSYMASLGYNSTGTNLNITYQNNTILMDSLLGMKYNLSKEKIMKHGFEEVAKKGDYTLYENKNALPLGTLTDENIYKEKFNSNQTALFKQLSGKNEELFKYTELTEVKRQNMQIVESGDYTFMSAQTPGEKQTITWKATVPAHSQAYLNLYADTGLDVKGLKVTLSVNGVERTTEASMYGQYFNLGNYQEAQEITFTASFSGQPVVKMIRPSITLLKTDVFDQAVEEIRKQSVTFETNGRTASADVQLETEQVLFTTIPFDQGWKAFADGKEIKIKPVNDGLIALELPKGHHKITLRFLPQGFVIGASLFVGCIGSFIGYSVILQQKKKRKEHA